jgi:ribA/ribD-fused uncharacterized protein
MSEELVQKCSQHDDQSIKGFFGEYRWLSNFHVCDVLFEGDLYPSSENAYQAAKFDWPDRPAFKLCSPNKAKKEGAGVTPKGWFNRNVDVMETILRDKFRKNRDLKDALVATGDKYLEEANWWKDTFWGVCDGVGENMLGKLLMKIRDELKNGN